jgi:hypothetical protein
LQPLVLLNDPQFVTAALALGERMIRKGGAAPSERLTFAFRLATTRLPTDRELKTLVNLDRDQHEQFRTQPGHANRFLASGLRTPAQDLNPVDLAAAGVVAGVILNLDASVMSR